MLKKIRLSPLVIAFLIGTIVTAGAVTVLIWQSQVLDTDIEVIGGILELLNPTHASYIAEVDATDLADTDSFLEFDGGFGVIENTATLAISDIYIGIDDLKLILDADVDEAIADLDITATAYYVCYYIDVDVPAVRVFNLTPMSFPVNRAGEEIALTIPNEWMDEITYSVPEVLVDPVIDNSNGIIVVVEFNRSAIPVGVYGVFPISYQVTAVYVE